MKEEVLMLSDKIKIGMHNGRSALLTGLNLFNLNNNSSVLVPDFICESVLMPFKKLGVKILYFSIKNDLSPDWDEIELISQKNSISAILMIHYFGQPQDINKFKFFCNEKKILLIDDNAHGHSGIANHILLGTSGDFGFSSPRKLLGISSGAFLYVDKIRYSEVTKLEMKFKKNNLFFFINSIKQSYFYQGFVKSIRNKFINWSDPYEFRDTAGFELRNNEKSQHFINQIDWTKYSKKRRENYENIQFYLTKYDLKPVFDTLSSSSCPWSLPMYADNLNSRNEWIKWGISNNVPLFTWPSLPTDIIRRNSTALIRWKKLICFPLENHFMKKYEKLKD